MSEYQYYEFRMIDRSLSADELEQIRKLSTRAEITSSSFKNSYEWGDFKGDPLEMMFQWYDAHVYTANWGSHEFMLAFPRNLLDPGLAERYLAIDPPRVHAKGDRVVIMFLSNPDDGPDEDDIDDDWLDHLLPLRADIAGGDYRALYLGWLGCIQEEYGIGYEEEDEDSELDDEAYFEPPVPPGMRELTEPLKALAQFLRIDRDLLAVAARTSADLTRSEPPAADLKRWVQALPAGTKDDLIQRILAGEGARLRPELLRHYHGSTKQAAPVSPPARRIGDLLAAASTHTEERNRKAAAAAAAARTAYLEKLGGQQETAWSRVEQLIDTKQSKSYDVAVTLLQDLRELGESVLPAKEFDQHLFHIRNRHAKKVAFIERLNTAGLRLQRVTALLE